MSEYILKTNHVFKSFKKTRAVKDLSMSVRKNSTVPGYYRKREFKNNDRRTLKDTAFLFVTLVAAGWM